MRAVHAGPLVGFQRSAFFLSRVPPGRRRARVVPAIENQTLAPADPLRGRARDAVFCHAFNANRRLDRVACNAPLGKLAAPRHQAGSTLPKWGFCIFRFLKLACDFPRLFRFRVETVVARA